MTIESKVEVKNTDRILTEGSNGTFAVFEGQRFGGIRDVSSVIDYSINCQYDQWKGTAIIHQSDKEYRFNFATRIRCCCKSNNQAPHSLKESLFAVRNKDVYLKLEEAAILSQRLIDQFLDKLVEEWEESSLLKPVPEITIPVLYLENLAFN